MKRLIAGLWLLLMMGCAFAQSTPAEPPAEPANMVAVIAFLVLFIGSCVGFIGYVWWGGRKSKREQGAE